MKTIVFLIAISISGCVFSVEEPLVPCGYEEQPHLHNHMFCDVNPWTYEGECCTWKTEGFYAECGESWCYNANTCGWTLNQYWCSPI